MKEEDFNFDYSEDNEDYEILKKMEMRAKKELMRIYKKVKKGVDFFEIDFNVISFFGDKLNEICRKYGYKILKVFRKSKVLKKYDVLYCYMVRAERGIEIVNPND